MNSAALALVPAPFAATAAERAVFRRRPRFSTYQWARGTLRVAAGPYKGKLWRADVAPYARAIMDAFDAQHVRKLFIVAPSQTTKTTIAYACLLADLCREMGPAGIGMPDEKALKRKFGETIARYVQHVPALREQLHADPRRAIQNARIEFRGGDGIYGMWAGSEAQMSSVSMRVVVIDEEDAYQDPGSVQTMEERVTAYEHMETSKILRVSKPRGLSEASTIWRDACREAQVFYRYAARCPACGELEIMDDARIRVVASEREAMAALPREERAQEIRRRGLARYECSHCGFGWTDETRNLALRRGRWLPGHVRDDAWQPCDAPQRPSVVAFHLRSWETVLVSLSAVLHDWFLAQGDPRRLQNYDNNRRAVPCRVVTRETPASAVMAMVDETLPRGTCPAETWAVTCGVDVQMLGCWYVVRAWARDGRSWLVDWGFLPGGLSEAEEVLLPKLYPVQGREGVLAPIWRTAVDTGGGRDGNPHGWSKTEETYAWLQQAMPQWPVFGVKGARREMPVAVRATTWGNQPGQPQRFQLFAGRIVGYLLDTAAFKDRIHARLSPSATASAMHLHAEAERGELAEYVKQVTAERKRVDKGREVWEAGGRANHLLDCEVYAAAAADPMWTPAMRLLPEAALVLPPDAVRHAKRQSRLAGLRRSPFGN
ncbi:phage terminase large subunit GpA-like protein [Desulfobaculum xiamenense]|uniref:Phage terminase large subunit GpA-like protein n=1 Tax=Desulfobaculum xiamenense TaxID=995050 RepID=A0A846QMH4_9BACT|nr:terminase gpA endonuclease subunit [Desulfobaculum xiamenense]NJB66454.1 phage terminase large subunit GpA-like protein [Desulfobaculum xiamenense]